MAGTLQLAGVDLASVDRDYQRACPRQPNRRPMVMAMPRRRLARSSTSTSRPWLPRSVAGRPGLVECQCHRPRSRFPGQGISPEPTRCRAVQPPEIRAVEGTQGELDSRPTCSPGKSPCFTCSISRSRSIPKLLRQITAKANAIEKTFNAYRASVNGRSITDSEVRRVLKESRGSAERQAVWEGSKAVGPLVEAELEGTRQTSERGSRQAGIPKLSGAPASSQ